MLGYATFGTNDIGKAATFFDELFAVIGGKRYYERADAIIYTRENGKANFGIFEPANGKPATVGNGTMMAIACDSTDMIDQLHAKALALGGTCEGAPGLRGEGFYGGYFRDLDGNKFVGYMMVPTSA